ncbi:hypothetical protein [Ilumatobacter nonamiensis]|uniref:hypothetical protein n=1 Tax=Ilumatobacter nonamiensis TaxID=467093 RepID=UPI00034A2BE7|nr:hypothetical protein [Ilumatobacter nonamiensis]
MSIVDERLTYVETKRPLVFDEIDFTIVDPDRVARELAAPLEYAQRVEAAVVGLGIETLMPRRDRRVQRFLHVWSIDEVGHGRALAELMDQLGIEAAPELEPRIPLHNQLVGVVTRLSRPMHQVVEAIWATAGAMNEHLAMAAYVRMDEILRSLGERALHESLFRTLRSHESAHKSFYAAYADEVMTQMDRWQRRLVALIVQHTYQPVGAGAKRDRPAFARTVTTLAGDHWEERIATPIQALAERLLNEGREMDPFVRDAVARCLASEPPRTG